MITLFHEFFFALPLPFNQNVKHAQGLGILSGKAVSGSSLLILSNFQEIQSTTITYKSYLVSLTTQCVVSLTTQCVATPAIVLIMGLFIYIWWLCEGYCYTNFLIMYSTRKQNVTESDKTLASKQTPILLTTQGPMKCRKLCMIKKWMPRRQRLSWLMNSRWAMEHNLGADAYLISRSYFY